MNEFKLVLVDPDAGLIEAMARQFAGLPRVDVVRSRFEVMSEYDCLIMPANSFGLIDAGITRSVARFFGDALVRRVQRCVLEEYLGEQPVGTSVLLGTGDPRHPFVAHTPIVRFQAPLTHSDHVYVGMWAALLAVDRHNRSSSQLISVVACPGLATSATRAPVDETARQMSLAYRHFLNPPDHLDQSYARRRYEEIQGADDSGFMGPRRLRPPGGG
jgi:O-acetyl-ADP-ribose deacetylase (regulator of RNase III)